MASKRHQRRKACGEKRRYETLDQALASRRDRELRAYRCTFCGAFHLGHSGTVPMPGVNVRR